MNATERAPDAREMLAQSFAALVKPSVFRAAAARPAPSTAACFSLALCASALSFAVLAAQWGWFGLASPVRVGMNLRLGAAAMFFAFQGISVLVWTAVLPLLARTLGGQGGVDRALQAAAMISVFASSWLTAQALPRLWMIPTLAAAWLALGALLGLFGTRPWLSRAAVAALAALALLIQSWARRQSDIIDHRKEIRQVEFGAAFARADILSSFEHYGPHVSTASPSGAAPSTSSLDLIRGLSDDRPALPPADGSPVNDAPNAPPNVNEGVARFLELTAPRLDDPRLLKDLTPEQKANVEEARRLIDDLRAKLKSGRNLDDPDFAREMMRYQQRMLKFMDGRIRTPSSGDPHEP